MKTLQELEDIKNRARKKFSGEEDAGTRITVGLATCGIAAGARPVLEAIGEAVKKRVIKNVTVSQTGCVGVCRLEPIVEVYEPGREKVTYVRVTPDMAARIVDEHIVNGCIVKEYTVGAAE